MLEDFVLFILHCELTCSAIENNDFLPLVTCKIKRTLNRKSLERFNCKNFELDGIDTTIITMEENILFLPRKHHVKSSWVDLDINYIHIGWMSREDFRWLLLLEAHLGGRLWFTAFESNLGLLWIPKLPNLLHLPSDSYPTMKSRIL